MNDLSGVRVLVTRPMHQAENLCRLIEEHGGEAIRLPTIEIVACTDLPQRISALKSPEPFHWLIFISANAVNFALPAISGKIARFTHARIAAIGRATANALASAGLAIDLLPEQGFDSEALLAMPQMQCVNGQRILIVRGVGGREDLANTLRNRGAEVDYLEVYRRLIPDLDCSPVITPLLRDGLDVITVTSIEALQNLLIMLGEQYHNPLTALPLVAISDRIARVASESGFKRIFVAAGPADTSILETVTMCTTGE